MNDTADRLRLFVAVNVPAEVKAALGLAQEKLRTTLPALAASWTRPDGLHLTLRFLGSVDAGHVPALTECLRRAAGGFGVVSLHCRRLDCFPDRRFPRVLWAGVEDQGDRLALLQRVVETAVAAFTRKPEESRFVGHVTLARFKHIHRTEAEVVARFAEDGSANEFGFWPCRDIELVRSELLPSGSRYSTLAKIPSCSPD